MVYYICHLESHSELYKFLTDEERTHNDRHVLIQKDAEIAIDRTRTHVRNLKENENSKRFTFNFRKSQLKCPNRIIQNDELEN